MDPGEVEPDLQVAQVALVEAAQGLPGAVAAEAPPLVQLGEACVRQDHGVGVGHEEVVEQEDRVGLAQAVGRHARDVEEAVAPALVGVLEELEQQARHQVDGAAHLGHLEQVQRHAVVVLHAVQADPRHGVLPRDVVGVVGLVLVPEQGERDHGSIRPGPADANSERSFSTGRLVRWQSE